ncbi:hypothetical protein [Enterococcus faecalis]|uniref:hypothetical protein n=1 Tax=Enterococcus faecalis TaxID=1351 RepID=UPI001A95A706|nr:hypothetical protein [Enterococcus faecalis]MBO1137170.1 hypothetical protein [Enterococcus faecalis]
MNLVQTLTQTLSEFSPGTLNWINSVITNSTRVVGFYIAGILIALEVVRLFDKANTSNGGLVTLKMFQGLSFRAAASGIAVGLSSYALQFMLFMGIGCVNLISNVANGAFDVFNIPKVEMSTDMISVLGGFFQALFNPGDAIKKGIMVLILMIIGALVTLIAYVMTWVIVMLRFFELYIMLACMPIPMASFASEEFNYIGKNYMKRVLAYAFQPVLILLVFGVYHFLSQISIDMSSFGKPGDFGMDASFCKNLILSVVFIIALWQTYKKSSELFGV